jgi:hypothetical protein
MSPPKVTTYIDPVTNEWLNRYADSLGIKRSELVRILIQRERRNHWLERAMDDPDAVPIRLRNDEPSA